MALNKSLDDYKKQDWLLHNTDKNIKNDDFIYRIFNVDYLIDDLKNQKMTLIHPCKHTQKDELENPLEQTVFTLEGKYCKLFSNIMSQYYSQSWTKREINEWNYFGGGKNTIRIKCKASLLFDRLMNIADSYYSLNYYMGCISYEDATDIQNNLSDNNFEKYLDSRGFKLLQTVLTLKSDFKSEDEVRLLYIRSPQADNLFPHTNTIFGDSNQYCSHVFDWRNVIDGYAFNPNDSSKSQGIINLINEYNSIKK